MASNQVLRSAGSGASTIRAPTRSRDRRTMPWVPGASSADQRVDRQT